MVAEFYARLGIFSDSLTPAQVTAILGLNCDRSHEKGPIVRPHATVYRKNHQWFMYSQISRKAPLEEHILDLLNRASPVRGKIKGIADQPGNDVELALVVHSKEEFTLNLSKEVIAALYQMGASVECDLYFFDRTWKVDTGLNK